MSENLQASTLVIRGRVVGVKGVDPKKVVRNWYLDSLGRESPRMLDFEVVADRVFKGCARPRERITIRQSRIHIAEAPQIGKGDSGLYMLRGGDDLYGLYYDIPYRNGRPGAEVEFRDWGIEVLEARVDSIIATQRGDSVLTDRNQTLLPDYGSITGQIVSQYDGTLHARNGIHVVMDNGREAITNWWGAFRFEGRAGPHVLTFPGTALKPRKVQIPAGCVDFVRITAPR